MMAEQSIPPLYTRLKRRLVELGRDEELAQILERIVDLQLAALPPDPGCRILSEHQLRHDRRRERPLWEEP